MNRLSYSSWLLTTVVVLSGCGSSDNDNNKVNVSELELLEVSDDKLTSFDKQVTESVILNGIFLNAIGGSNFTQEGDTSNAVNSPVADSAPEGGFSQTTTQEIGVDEADRVKYDGERMFLASNNSGFYEYLDTAAIDSQEQQLLQQPHVRILGRNEDSTLTQQSIMALHQDAVDVNDLYIHEERLAAIYGVYQPTFTPASSDAAVSMWYPYSQHFGIKFADVSDENQLVEMANFIIDGYVLDSRRIGDKMYVVSSYAADYAVAEYPENEQQQQDFYQTLLNDEDLQLLPMVTANGETKPFVDAENCYLPESVDDNTGFHSVVTLTTFDLNQPQSYQSICVLASIEGFYASSEAIYLFNSIWVGDNPDATGEHQMVMHKFAYSEDGVDYQATGKVNGHAGWQNPHLRFSEKDDVLRVVTSDWNETEGLFHRLLVLQTNESERELELIAHLPNEQNPEKIGKPGEDVYAVRYWGDKAYVVTFETRDPLYVIDLSEPVAPKIQGELDIPGFSAYLQPISDDFILGVGQQIDPNAINQFQEVNDSNTDALIEGAKIELYDVSDPNNPVVAATIVYEHAYSPVEWDYHALSQLNVSDTDVRFTLPIYGWLETEIEPNTYSWDFFNRMVLLDVDLDSGEMTQAGSLEADSEYYGSWGDRAVMHGNDVYYIRNNQVWLGNWLNPGDLIGPF